MRTWIELSSVVLEGLAVAVITGTALFASVRFVIQVLRRVPSSYRDFKEVLGRALLSALEFLVAADVIRTVALDLTPRNIWMLGALVAIRTFLSWSVVVEIEGHWPWQARRGNEARGNGEWTELSPHLFSR